LTEMAFCGVLVKLILEKYLLSEHWMIEIIS